MRRLASSSRWAAWAFAFALLLKAAVPMLAAAAAQVQGKALVEVCTVYGVATVAADGDGAAPHPEHGASKAGDHCALAAVVAATATQASAALSIPAPAASLGGLRPDLPILDAAGAWRARLEHGPPRRA